MIVDGVLILYTSNPNCPQMRTWAMAFEAITKQPVFFKPLTQLEQRKKAAISPEVMQTLPTVQPN